MYSKEFIFSLSPQAVRRTADGNVGFSDVKTLTIHCRDFRTIHLIFMDTPQSVHNYLIPSESHSNLPSPNSILSSIQPTGDYTSETNAPKKTGGTHDEVSSLGITPLDSLHVVEAADDPTRSSSLSSFQILSHSSSSSSVEVASSYGSESLVIVPQGSAGVLGPGVLAAAFGGGEFMSDATSRLKTEVSYATR